MPTLNEIHEIDSFYMGMDTPDNYGYDYGDTPGQCLVCNCPARFEMTTMHNGQPHKELVCSECLKNYREDGIKIVKVRR